MRADEKPVSHYAKANEAIAYTSKCGEEIKCADIDYINQVRVDRLMAKARELTNKAWYYAWLNNDKKMIDKCRRIAEAYEARARRIKEGM